LDQDKPAKRWVKIGIRNDEYTEILDGLEEGESVIIDNIDFEV
jgi:multidrug efflux pump subunit AcrA (membrane-fusion protein)